MNPGKITYAKPEPQDSVDALLASSGRRPRRQTTSGPSRAEERKEAEQLLKSMQGASATSGNDLGESMKVPTASGPVRISYRVLVNRYGRDLISEELLRKLCKVEAALKNEADIIENHSSVTVQKKAMDLVQNYHHRPSEEILHKVRNHRSLSDFELATTQFIAKQRMQEIQAKQLAPILLEVHRQAAELVAKDAERVFQAQSDFYKEFEVSPMPSPLVLELQRIRKEIISPIGPVETRPEMTPRSSDLLEAILAAAAGK